MKSKIYILLAVGILMFSVADVNAQVKGGSFSITPLAGYSMFKYRSSFEDTATYGLALGYNFSERFSLEATYNIIDTEVVPEGIAESGGGGGFPPPPMAFRGAGNLVVFQPPPPAPPTIIADGGTEVDGYQYAIEMLYYIYPGKKFAPYGVLGVGMTEMEYALNEEGDYGTGTISNLNAPIGLGFKYFVTDMIEVRGDLRFVYPFDENNMRATVGVTFQLGGK